MEQGRISALQMAFMMYPAIVATAILGLPSVTAKYASNDLWMSPIVGSIAGFATVFFAYQLNKLYPQYTVIQFSEQILGRFAGNVISFIILFFYIQATGQIARSYSEFIVDSFLVRTPLSIVIILMIVLCAFAVRGGAEVIGRTTTLFLPLLIFPLLILTFLVIPDMDVKNIFPILGNGVMPPIKGAIVPGGWFAEIFLITFFLPILVDQKKGLKAGFLTILAVTVTLVLVNLIVLFVLGATAVSKVYPLMNVARYISLANFFEHLESSVMAIWVIGAFIKISVFYYASALGLAQWLKLSDYRTIVFPLGILIVMFSFWSLPSNMALERYIIGAFPFYSVLIQTIIPLCLLLAALMRGKKNQGS